MMHRHRKDAVLVRKLQKESPEKRSGCQIEGCLGLSQDQTARLIVAIY
jgi:hypothetical protein